MLDVNKISRLIYQPTKDLSLKLHVKLVKENSGRKENFHNIFEVEGNKYLRLDLQSFLTVELTDGEWSRDKTIVLDQRNIIHFIKGLEKCVNNIYNGGIFAQNKEGDIIIYSDMAEKCTVRIYNLGMNQKVVLKPSIVYDENEVSYEGALLYLNKSSNVVQLTIDSLESFLYNLKQVNLFVYSQLLLNYFVSAIREEKISLKHVTLGGEKYKKKIHPLLMSGEDKEITKSNIPSEDVNSFFGFNK